MDKKAHEALERIRKDVTLTTSDMENQDAAEFFNRKSRMIMRIDDQDKLIKAGFCIIRKDDYPGPRIKMCTGINGGWKTYKKFETKAERNRTFALLLKDDKVIAD